MLYSLQINLIIAGNAFLIIFFHSEAEKEWRMERSGLMRANREFVEEVSSNSKMFHLAIRRNNMIMLVLNCPYLRYGFIVNCRMHSFSCLYQKCVDMDKIIFLIRVS